jgi:hypothetical protein
MTKPFLCPPVEYITPIVKDNEMKVAVIAAESIITEETHDFYIWIIRST